MARRKSAVYTSRGSPGRTHLASILRRVNSKVSVNSRVRNLRILQGGKSIEYPGW